MMSDPLMIVCGADTRYVRPLGVMLRSVVANLSPNRKATVYILDAGIEPKHKAEVTATWDPELVTAHWIPTEDGAFDGVPLWGRMPVTTYYKLRIADMLPPAVRRAIWLDCDLVVVSDLARLWDTDCGDHHVMAVQDSIVPLVSSPFGVTHYTQLGIPATAKYFNAGVMAAVGRSVEGLARAVVLHLIAPEVAPDAIEVQVDAPNRKLAASALKVKLDPTTSLVAQQPILRSCRLTL